MASAEIEVFTSWLTGKLRELNTDETVFGTYITGILEGEETEEEKSEALEGILSEIITDSLDDVVKSILNKWKDCHPDADASAKKGAAIDVNEQLTKLLEAQMAQATIKGRQITEEEKRIKQQILSQYSQAELSEEDCEEEEECEKQSGSNKMGAIARNTNASDVMQMQKDRREQSRQECAAKKQKDKEDREKQKQQREDKKEKRKTVKGERRR